MGGNINFLARFGYMGNLSFVKDYLPPYKYCYSNMKSSPSFLIEDIKCEKCACWYIMKNNTLTMLNAPNTI